MNILIAGFPYIRKEYRDTFKEYPKDDRIFFLLPKNWPIKKGAVIFEAPNEPNTISTHAFFYHSHYPLIGGLLKGCMPMFPIILFKNRKNTDLVYSCSEPTLLTTLYYGVWTTLFGKKHIMFSWENIPYENKFHGLSGLVHSIILHLNLLFCDGIICGNQKGADMYKKLTTKPIAVVPMSGVDDQFFRRVHGSKIFRGQDWTNKVVFTFAGAIGYRKGIHLIIKVFSGVIKKIPNAHLVIAGSGEYESEIDNLIAQNQLGLAVTRISWLDRTNLRTLLNTSDIFLYPSLPYRGWEEQFGYSMAEASLMELPIIATRSGSIEDVVVHEKTGLLIKTNDNMQLQDAMIRLASNEILRKKFGEAGRQYIVNNFSHRIIVEKFHSFFNQVMYS